MALQLKSLLEAPRAFRLLTVKIKARAVRRLGELLAEMKRPGDVAPTHRPASPGGLCYYFAYFASSARRNVFERVIITPPKSRKLLDSNGWRPIRTHSHTPIVRFLILRSGVRISRRTTSSQLLAPLIHL